MHEPAGVVEILVQILREYPYSELGTENPLPQNENCQSKSESFRIPPQHENCQRVQSKSFRILPPKWKLSESPNPRVSEYPPPQMKIVRESKSESFRIPPQWKLSESPNLRVSEYPPQMKIVRESKSESFRIPPQNENCQRVQIQEFQNMPPPMKIVRESKSKSFRIPPPPIGKTSDFKLQNSLSIREIVCGD